MSESLETIRDEFEKSQDASWERRRQHNTRRTNWTYFWIVLVVGCWIIAGLFVAGVFRF